MYYVYTSICLYLYMLICILAEARVGPTPEWLRMALMGQSRLAIITTTTTTTTTITSTTARLEYMPHPESEAKSIVFKDQAARSLV